jgi:hypothetical protein
MSPAEFTPDLVHVTVLNVALDGVIIGVIVALPSIATLIELGLNVIPVVGMYDSTVQEPETLLPSKAVAVAVVEP